MAAAGGGGAWMAKAGGVELISPSKRSLLLGGITLLSIPLLLEVNWATDCSLVHYVTPRSAEKIAYRNMLNLYRTHIEKIGVALPNSYEEYAARCKGCFSKQYEFNRWWTVEIKLNSPTYPDAEVTTMVNHCGVAAHTFPKLPNSVFFK